MPVFGQSMQELQSKSMIRLVYRLQSRSDILEKEIPTHLFQLDLIRANTINIQEFFI